MIASRCYRKLWFLYGCDNFASDGLMGRSASKRSKVYVSPHRDNVLDRQKIFRNFSLFSGIQVASVPSSSNQKAEHIFSR